MDRAARWEKLMKDSIVEGVIAVLTEHGSEGLTMKRVADQAGVAKGTLYTYFENKEELLEATIQAALEPLRGELRSASTDSPEERLAQIVDRHLSFFDDNTEVFRVLIYERHRVFGEWARYETSSYHAFVDQVATVIDRGIEAGLFRPLDSVKVATMLVEANVSVIHRRLFGNANDPVETDRDLILEIFLSGIRREPDA